MEACSDPAADKLWQLAELPELGPLTRQSLQPFPHPLDRVGAKRGARAAEQLQITDLLTAPGSEGEVELAEAALLTAEEFATDFLGSPVIDRRDNVVSLFGRPAPVPSAS